MYVQTEGEDIGKMKNTRGVLKNVYFTVQDEERERKRKRGEPEGFTSLPNGRANISQIRDSIIVCQCERLIYIPARFNKCSSHVHPIIGILASLFHARGRVSARSMIYRLRNRLR